MQDVGRRGFIVTVGVAVSAASAAACATKAKGEGAPIGGTERERELAQATLHGLAAGAVIARWRVAAVHALRFGAVPVVLESEAGARFQVDVLRRDPDAAAPTGIGNTDALSLYLSNEGDGTTATVEEQGLAAMALADELGERTRGMGGDAAPAELLTLRQRLERFPRDNYEVPLA